MRWPFQEWGASVVLTGHEHVYERLGVGTSGGPGTFPYIINGLGGHSWVYDIHTCDPDPRSKVCSCGADLALPKCVVSGEYRVTHNLACRTGAIQ